MGGGMRLRNKKTGEIKEFVLFDGKNELQGGATLKDLVKEWEDYEEPKGNWTIDPMNENYIDDGKYTAPDELERYEELGLKFDTKEEAEKAVEKLKAFANLRKRGLKFNGWDEADRGMVGEFAIYCDALELDGIERELEIVFGREEL